MLIVYVSAVQFRFAAIRYGSLLGLSRSVVGPSIHHCVCHAAPFQSISVLIGAFRFTSRAPRCWAVPLRFCSLVAFPFRASLFRCRAFRSYSVLFRFMSLYAVL